MIPQIEKICIPTFFNCQSDKFLHISCDEAEIHFVELPFVTSNFVHNLIELLTVRSGGSE